MLSKISVTDNCILENEEPGIMLPGHCFTIEVGIPCRFITTNSRFPTQPIIMQTVPGEKTDIFLWMDNWTASTENGARAAVFEHTVLITENGVDILTAL